MTLGSAFALPYGLKGFVMSSLQWTFWLLLCGAALMLCSSVFLEEAGIVGEVALGWRSFPTVLTDTDPISTSQLSNWGPFERFQTRPILRFGDWPWAINLYTSGLMDWPSRILTKAGATELHIRLWHAACGVLPLTILSLGLRNLIPARAALMMGVLFVTNWHFLVYKSLLGGTEIALQTAWCAVLVGLVQLSQNHSAGRWLGIGIGLGLLAKWTFGICLIAAAPLLWKWRHRVEWKSVLTWTAAFSWPQLITAIAFFKTDIIIRSHDFGEMQLTRVLDALKGSGPPRESFSNVWHWLIDPLHFFELHYGAVQQSTWWLLHPIALVIAVITLRWASPLCRWCWGLLLAQVLLIGVVAKDMHHLAMAIPLLLLCFTQLPRRIAVLTSALWVAGNLSSLLSTNNSWSSITVPTFNRSNQELLRSTLRQHHVQRLVTMDYEVMGMLEDESSAAHTWGAISHQRRATLPRIIEHAAGGHMLVLQSSSSMIYNLKPTDAVLEQHAKTLGLKLSLLEQWSEDRLRLYSVTRAE